MLVTYQLCKQFFWGHVERHGVNNLENQKKNLSNNLIQLHSGLVSAAATVRGIQNRRIC